MRVALAFMCLLWSALVSAEEGVVSKLKVSVTLKALAETDPGDAPYVLRFEGLRVPGDRGSRVTVYGADPAKHSAPIGTAKWIGWKDGPRLQATGNFVVPLTREASKLISGRRFVEVWIKTEGMKTFRVSRAVLDVSKPQ